MARQYFADTFYWVALAHGKDTSHVRVLAWQQAHPTARFVTTEEVLAEVLTWFAPTGPTLRGVAVKMVERVLVNPGVLVLPQTSPDFRAARLLYAARPDKKYSLTDCRSMLAMRALGISDVLSNDHHFTQEGFTVLFA